MACCSIAVECCVGTGGVAAGDPTGQSPFHALSLTFVPQ